MQVMIVLPIAFSTVEGSSAFARPGPHTTTITATASVLVALRIADPSVRMIPPDHAGSPGLTAASRLFTKQGGRRAENTKGNLGDLLISPAARGSIAAAR